MIKFLTVPFVLECVINPECTDVSYVIVRDPENRVSCVETSLFDANEHIYEVLDELVFAKKKDNNKDEN